MDLLVAAARGLRPLSRNLTSRLHSRPRASHFSSSSSSTPSSSFRAKSATASASASSVNQLRRYTSQPLVPQHPPKSILIVNKLRTKPVVDAIDTLLKHIKSHYPETKVFHEDRPDIPEGANVWRPGDDALPIDLVVTLGGDGTILHASSLFKKGAVPPVLSFSMGTLGFLLPFHIDDYAPALESAFTGRVTVLYRMRLSCTFHDRDGKPRGGGEAWQVMNEVALHRGRSAHLTTLDAFVDGQHLTEAVADGLIVATPTGSTAYSLSAGGPIVHPSLAALVLTPICPRSLSFRPLVFPAGSSITLRIGQRSRAPAGVSMDGQEALTLEPGESLTVRASPFPIPCINRSSITIPPESGFAASVSVSASPSPLAVAHASIAPGASTSATAPTPTPTDATTAPPPGHSLPGAEGARPGPEDDWVRDINNLLQYNATFRSKALLRHSRP